MDTERRTITASKFRQQCLRLLDEVHATGNALVVTKHGRPVARVEPEFTPPEGSIIGFNKGSIIFHDDLSEPAFQPEEWEMISNPDRILTGGWDDDED